MFHISRIFEKIIYAQMEPFLKRLLRVEEKPQQTMLITAYGRVLEKHS